jgi:hypothetical protein
MLISLVFSLMTAEAQSKVSDREEGHDSGRVAKVRVKDIQAEGVEDKSRWKR